MRILAGLAFAVALSACASTDPVQPVAMLQNSVYVVGDQSATVKPMETPAAAVEEKADVSALKRLYWFFAGR
jgi:hypothetical protein